MRREIFAPAILLAACLLLFSGQRARAGTLYTLPIIGYAFGVDGQNVVGRSGSFGFLYDGSTYSTILPPGAVLSSALDIQGNRIVGYFDDAKGSYGSSQ
jgi:hypothetical protein